MNILPVMPKESTKRPPVTNGASNYSKETVRIREYRGLYSRVARELGVDRSYVSRVASGERVSERVQRALEREVTRIEKSLSKPQPKIRH